MMRTPAMSICVDLTGTEKFCLDLALQATELFELYEALRKVFSQEVKIVANGPGKYVKWLENLTISTIGPQRYRDLLVNVYDECVPILEKRGKRVMVHYDGELSCIRNHIVDAPFHIIESLTEPPEGDMMYEECRSIWPDKVFWANINVALYGLPKPELQLQITSKLKRAGKTAFAFEVSEDMPSNWRSSIPSVLDCLAEYTGC
jgi:hypothetical protein